MKNLRKEELFEKIIKLLSDEVLLTDETFDCCDGRDIADMLKKYYSNIILANTREMFGLPEPKKQEVKQEFPSEYFDLPF